MDITNEVTATTGTVDEELAQELAEVMAIIDARLDPRELIQPPDRAGWVSDAVDAAMRRVFGDATYPYDYHSFAIRLGIGSEDITRKLRPLQKVLKVPLYLAGEGVSEEEAALLWEKYSARSSREEIVIFSRVDTVALAAATAAFYEDFRMRHKEDQLARLTQQDFDEFDKSFREANPLTTKVSEFLVDYANFRDGYFNFVELKLTGNTDCGKSKNTVTTQLLGSFVAAGDCPKRMFLGIVTNSQGVRPADAETHHAGEWGGYLGAYLHKDMILIEGALWALVGPRCLSWRGYQNAVMDKFVASFEWWAKTDGERAIILEKEASSKEAIKQAARDSRRAAREAAKIAAMAVKQAEKEAKRLARAAAKETERLAKQPRLF